MEQGRASAGEHRPSVLIVGLEPARTHPGGLNRYVDDLTAAGTKTLLVAANPDPGIDFMDPAGLAAAIEDGAARATSLIDDLAAVWQATDAGPPPAPR